MTLVAGSDRLCGLRLLSNLCLDANQLHKSLPVPSMRGLRFPMPGCLMRNPMRCGTERPLAVNRQQTLSKSPIEYLDVGFCQTPPQFLKLWRYGLFVTHGQWPMAMAPARSSSGLFSSQRADGSKCDVRQAGSKQAPIENSGPFFARVRRLSAGDCRTLSWG
jgi:hypothetical protein